MMLPSPVRFTTRMDRDGGIDQIAAERAQPRKRPLLVGTSELAVSGCIRKNGCELPGLRHGSPLLTLRRVARLVGRETPHSRVWQTQLLRRGNWCRTPAVIFESAPDLVLRFTIPLQQVIAL
jgi:hypothetical protein